jgi:hypothetical protein
MTPCVKKVDPLVGPGPGPAAFASKAPPNPMDPDVTHVIAEGAEIGHEKVSIVIPALNEEITVGEFVEWCKEGLKRAGIKGQILIVDSSTDNTPNVVLEHGGEVLRTPKRGLGRAYIDAIPFIRGEWVLMGDADLTYDFRELEPFLARFRQGFEFVMGSRFTGSIEKGAMPRLHRYFGTPLTTWILNFIYRSNFSDIHCGMRGITRQALLRINLQSQSWEYASEMVLKAVRMGLRISEAPVKFYKDRAGRTSHHRREGFLSPWIAGWLNLKVMLVYTPDSFLLKPGILLTAVGAVIAGALMRGPVTIGGVGLSLHWLLFGMTCVTLGYSSIQIGVLARVMHGLRPESLKGLRRVLTYDRGMLLSGICVLLGMVLLTILVYHYLNFRFRLIEISHAAIFGLLLIIVGFQTFCFTLLLEMVQRIAPERRF